MRPRKLPDGGYDKVISMCRDLLSRRHENSETWWRRTTATFLGVLFGTYRRRRRDVVMGRRGYVPLRPSGNVPLRRLWVFHLRLF